MGHARRLICYDGNTLAGSATMRLLDAIAPTFEESSSCNHPTPLGRLRGGICRFCISWAFAR